MRALTAVLRAIAAKHGQLPAHWRQEMQSGKSPGASADPAYPRFASFRTNPSLLHCQRQEKRKKLLYVPKNLFFFNRKRICIFRALGHDEMMWPNENQRIKLSPSHLHTSRQVKSSPARCHILTFIVGRLRLGCLGTLHSCTASFEFVRERGGITGLLLGEGKEGSSVMAP